MRAAQPRIAMRPYLAADAPLLAEIFRASVEELTGEDYSSALARLRGVHQLHRHKQQLHDAL